VGFAFLHDIDITPSGPGGSIRVLWQSRAFPIKLQLFTGSSHLLDAYSSIYSVEAAMPSLWASWASEMIGDIIPKIR
jgi:hypothetical protein